MHSLKIRRYKIYTNVYSENQSPQKTKTTINYCTHIILANVKMLTINIEMIPQKTEFFCNYTVSGKKVPLYFLP